MRRFALYGLVGIATVASVGGPLWLALLADVDGALPWALLGIVAFASLVLAVLAGWGIHDSAVKDRMLEALQVHSTLGSANLDSTRAVVAELWERQRSPNESA